MTTRFAFNALRRSIIPWPIFLALVGPALADIVTVSPESLNFGSQAFFTTQNLGVTLSNGTHKTLTFSSITVSGDFSLQLNSCPAKIQPNDSCGIVVAFTPTATGTLTGTLAIFDDANNSPQKVKLTGVGVGITGTFLPAASMNAGRNYHAATTLTDGRVLITGGIGDAQPMPMPEIYEPMTASFSVTGAMSTGRYGHTATLLPNGKVLVAGGASLFAVLAMAEIYDPSTGTFSSTGSMSTPRYFHTATPLQGGRVLIAGGKNELNSPLASAEVYDPNTGIFTLVGSMAQSRDFHTATLLLNGQVLVTGGSCFCGSNQVTATAELFDPATQSFHPTGNLVAPRTFHTAGLLLNGKVLIAGGSFNDGSLPTNGELYDPSTGQFTETGAMVTPRIQHTMTVLNKGKVLLAGGTTVIINANGNLATGELYDPSSGQFTAVPGSMSVTREFAAAALLPSGIVLITGGFDGQKVSTTGDYYIPSN